MITSAPEKNNNNLGINNIKNNNKCEKLNNNNNINNLAP